MQIPHLAVHAGVAVDPNDVAAIGRPQSSRLRLPPHGAARGHRLAAMRHGIVFLASFSSSVSLRGPTGRTVTPIQRSEVRPLEQLAKLTCMYFYIDVAYST